MAEWKTRGIGPAGYDKVDTAEAEAALAEAQAKEARSSCAGCGWAEVISDLKAKLAEAESAVENKGAYRRGYQAGLSWSAARIASLEAALAAANPLKAELVVQQQRIASLEAEVERIAPLQAENGRLRDEISLAKLTVLSLQAELARLKEELDDCVACNAARLKPAHPARTRSEALLADLKARRRKA